MGLREFIISMKEKILRFLGIHRPHDDVKEILLQYCNEYALHYEDIVSE